MDKKYTQLALQFPLLKDSRLLSVDEIYETATQALLEDLTEDRRIERKPPGIHASALGEYFSMYANKTPDGGIIVLGQENDGTISGCSTASQPETHK